ncbi:DUF4279 domain-containing protein [Xanthomonas hortorum]|uniref:DUF4279 domain-containing protein n=1 Tax=Xanthomonas hortorum TaxID=56454 RepID=UPI0015948AB5|nr:DUF4279 domain-containing protein [Xanthomonas hortorum]NHF67530.1 DUF4279 domain-containing protein [Xanthomonas hortorum]
MGALEYSVATLRFFGDDLVPDEISALLLGSPTASKHKGQELKSKSGVVSIAKTGSWRLTSTRREPEDLEAQIFEILDQLTQDLSVWAHLSNRYEPDLFCGIFMAGRNDGLPLSAKALLALGQRGISLGLDIYDPTR